HDLGRTQGATARHGQQCRRDLFHAGGDATLELIDPAGEFDDVGQLVAGNLGDQALAADQISPQLLLVLGPVQVLGRNLGVELVDVPLQPVDRGGAVLDQVFTPVDQQLQFP